MNNDRFNELLSKQLWAGELLCTPVCGERFKKGWFCSRAENHDGPCAAYRMPTRWQRFCWWLDAHRPRIHIGPCQCEEGCHC